MTMMGAAILREIDVVHPAAKSMIELSRIRMKKWEMELPYCHIAGECCTSPSRLQKIRLSSTQVVAARKRWTLFIHDGKYCA